MICEIKHYQNDEKPFGMWVNNEYVGDYRTIQEAVGVYEHMLRKERIKENDIHEPGAEM